jgi:hypothetical protein
VARRIVRLNAAEARAYRSVVEPLVPVIERTLGPEVLASRAWGRGDVPTTGLEPWRPARRAWRGALRAALEEDPGAVLVADVRRCYESIRPDALGDRLRAMGISSTWTRDVLERLEGLEGAGLPVGPAPSAVLANAVLGALDEALREAGVPHVRGSTTSWRSQGAAARP